MRVKTHYFLYGPCLGLIAGVAAASFALFWLPAEPLIFFGLGVIGAAAAAVMLRRKRAWALFLLVLAAGCLGIWRYQLSQQAPPTGHIRYFAGERAEVAGIVAEEPERSSRLQKITLVAESASWKGEERFPVRGRVLVYAPFFPEVAYGDRLRLNCGLDEPEPFAGFAYDRYLARHDIYVVCFYPEIREQEPGFGHPVWTGLFQVKKRLRETLERGLEEPAASLAKAMVLGDKSAIAEHERELFARAGLSHVIAISGMHIGTISAIIMFILFGAGFTRKQAFYWAAAALIIYVFLIGFPASAVRASIMGLFVLLAMHCGRLNRLGYALALAAAFMLLFNPRLLRDDIGFQLSFLAVLGIGWFYSPVSAALKRLKMPPLYGTRIILAVTIAAQILTVPLALYYFGIISFVSPLANVLVVSLLPALLFLVFMALFLSWLLPGLAWAWFMPAWAVLAYAQKTASFLVSLPGAYYETEIGREWLWVYYGTAVLTAVLLRKYRLSVPGF